MGISELEPRDAPPRVAGCPRCGRADAVQRVPMAASAGKWFTSAGPPQDLGKRPVGVVAGALLSASFADAAGNAWHASPQGPYLLGVLGFVLCGAVAVVNGLGIVGILKRRKRIKAGKPAALAVWNEGWSCGRCGVVYFQPGYEPKGVGLHQAITHERFRYEVYRAGGYEDLARE